MVVEQNLHGPFGVVLGIHGIDQVRPSVTVEIDNAAAHRAPVPATVPCGQSVGRSWREEPITVVEQQQIPGLIEEFRSPHKQIEPAIVIDINKSGSYVRS